jgi:hypothetical protein
VADGRRAICAYLHLHLCPHRLRVRA